MSDDTITAEPLEGKVITISSDDEYAELVKRLDREFPPVSKRGFDFSKIRGNLVGRTAKAIVLHLSFHGWSISQIAEAFEVSNNAVGRYLADAISEASPMEDVDVLRKFESRKLDEQARVCWEEFQRSCEDDVQVTMEPDEDGEMVVIKEIRRGQSGNPAYQRILAEIGKRRAALDGLDQPTEVHIDKTERKLSVTIVEVKTREEVEAARAAGLLKQE